MTARRLIKLLLLLMALAVFPAANCTRAETTAPSYRTSAAELRARIAQALADKSLKRASVGISIKSLKSGEVIYENLSDRPLVPASNMKLVTTAAALEKLGRDYRFVTRFYLTDAPDENGVVKGALIARGSGDPNISGRFQPSVTALFEKVRDKLKERGAREIADGIIIDDTIFDRVYTHPSWPKEQLSNWYCAEVSAVSFNDNCVDLTIEPNKKIGAPVNVRSVPDTQYVNIKNGCTTTASKKEHGFSFSRRTDTNNIQVAGKYWKNAKPHSESVTVHNPGLYFGTVLREVVRGGGVAVTGTVRLASRSYDEEKDNLVLVDEIVSEMMPTVTVANQRSQNFYAEQLFKLLGHVCGDGGSFEEGARIVSEYLAELKIDRQQFVVSDGSGLSPQNRLTASGIIAVLEHMYSSALSRQYFESLAVSGADGTSMSSRLSEAPYAGRVHAKTGTLNGVSALSGYVETLDGDVVAFSILVNNHSGNQAAVKKFEDAVCRMLVDLRRQ